MNGEIETDRLRLRRRREDDLDANLLLDVDPEVRRYVYDAPPDPVRQREMLLEQIRSGWPAGGAFWVVEWKEAPTFLGCCALLPVEEAGVLELGYRFFPRAWGRGVATEAAAATLEHGFAQFGMQAAAARVHPLNAGSLRVLAKLGFHPAKAAEDGELQLRLERARTTRLATV